MDLILQIWGGACYLTNKILFAFGATSQINRKRYTVAAWVIYIIGVPAWVIILLGHQNWIAASVEAGGIPAMMLGLFNSIRDERQAGRLANGLVSICTYGALVLGLSYSISLNGELPPSLSSSRWE